MRDVTDRCPSDDGTKLCDLRDGHSGLCLFRRKRPADESVDDAAIEADAGSKMENESETDIIRRIRHVDSSPIRAASAARTIIEEIGAEGPEDVESVATRAVSLIRNLRADNESLLSTVRKEHERAVRLELQLSELAKTWETIRSQGKVIDAEQTADACQKMNEILAAREKPKCNVCQDTHRLVRLRRGEPDRLIACEHCPDLIADQPSSSDASAERGSTTDPTTVDVSGASKAVERLLTLLYVYPAHEVCSREPYGCILEAIMALAPDVATRLHNGQDPAYILFSTTLLRQIQMMRPDDAAPMDATKANADLDAALTEIANLRKAIAEREARWKQDLDTRNNAVFKQQAAERERDIAIEHIESLRTALLEAWQHFVAGSEGDTLIRAALAGPMHAEAIEAFQAKWRERAEARQRELDEMRLKELTDEITALRTRIGDRSTNVHDQVWLRSERGVAVGPWTQSNTRFSVRGGFCCASIGLPASRPRVRRITPGNAYAYYAYESWEEGPAGIGTVAECRKWCDTRLRELGYVLVDDDPKSDDSR